MGRYDNGLFDAECKNHRGGSPSTIAIRWAEIRFAHIIHGFGDFRPKAYRENESTGGIGEIKMLNRKRPFNTDLLRWMTRNLGIAAPKTDGAVMVTSATSGHFFSMGLSEIEALKNGDVEIGEDEGEKPQPVLPHQGGPVSQRGLSRVECHKL